MNMVVFKYVFTSFTASTGLEGEKKRRFGFVFHQLWQVLSSSEPRISYLLMRRIPLSKGLCE